MTPISSSITNPQTFSPQKVKWFAWGSLMSVPIAWCIDALKRINVFVLTVCAERGRGKGTLAAY